MYRERLISTRTLNFALGIFMHLSSFSTSTEAEYCRSLQNTNASKDRKAHLRGYGKISKMSLRYEAIRASSDAFPVAEAKARIADSACTF